MSLLIVWLGIVIGQIPLQGTILWFFLVALFFAYLLMLLSFGAGVRGARPVVAAAALPGHDIHPDRLWPGFRVGRPQ